MADDRHSSGADQRGATQVTRDRAELEQLVERLSAANRELRSELEQQAQRAAERESEHAAELESLQLELRQKRRNLDRVHWAGRRDRQLLARIRRNPAYRVARKLRHSRPVVAVAGSPHRTVSAEQLISESGREAEEPGRR